jgi:hypothetical protein
MGVIGWLLVSIVGGVVSGLPLSSAMGGFVV